LNLDQDKHSLLRGFGRASVTELEQLVLIVGLSPTANNPAAATCGHVWSSGDDI